MPETARLHIGTAAWALPRQVRDSFPPGASNLARYAARFDATERGIETWVIFDNTASGAATADALAFSDLPDRSPRSHS